MTTEELRGRSIDIILENQAASGAYLASPHFPVYRYSWFRDGAFIAHAMDRVGERDSARRFHDWAARTVLERRERVARVVEARSRGDAPAAGDLLHTRYRADGTAGTEQWENFQLDGLGTWLWSLAEHVRMAGMLVGKMRDAAAVAAEYLATLWDVPCYDLWEEHPDRTHTYTLASIYGGLQACAALGVHRTGSVSEELLRRIEQGHTRNGHYVKWPGTDMVDASLLGLAVPYGAVDLNNPRFLKTLETMERTIWEGGLHRYQCDTYFGGGAWVLLTAWWAWVQRLLGNSNAAAEALQWVEAQATPDGMLPEQVPIGLIDPSSYPRWVEKWGEIATPLLWSHAMYLIALDA